ncbi:DUF4870 domain-containing protein [Planococcus liqunii]|uniref:DUF4870 domain-containing protein n=1 Tax=Planococcus liqunii TaxID=3058394 RepID=UPI0026397090|nr:DUF4870 domain-containing protein [Planococcus sp. N056]WKA50062.1 DUF4870 domain-containing protein [Planococcus sp. N056]
MIENNFKMSDEQHLSNLDKQTVFKRPAEVGAVSPDSTSIGLHENIAGSLAYLLGFFTGFVLLLIERENRFVRFHAIQSIYLSISFLIVFVTMGMLPVVGWLSGVILSPIGLVLWIILMLNAYNGKYSKIAYIGEIAEKQAH